MDQRDYERLLIEIETEKGLRAGHERECAVRYEAINQRFGGFERKLDKVIEKAERADGNWSKRSLAVIGAVMTLLVGLIAWESGQLYSDNQAKITAAAAKH